MKNNDKGMRELLDLLKRHPELLGKLVFDPESIVRLLKNPAAKRRARGVDAATFLSSLPSHAEAPLLCVARTRSLRAGRRHFRCAAGATWIQTCLSKSKPG